MANTSDFNKEEEEDEEERLLRLEEEALQDLKNRDVFSYEADIAPINRRFFMETAKSGLPPAAAMSTLDAGLNISNKYYQEQQNINKLEQDRVVRQLSVVSQLQKLEEDKRKMRLERTRMERLVPFEQGLNSILSSNAPDEQKRKQLSLYGVANGTFIANNEGAKTMMSNADQYLKPYTPEKRNVFTVSDYVRNNGDPKLLEQYRVAYEQQTKTPLFTDDELPVGLITKGMASAREYQEQRSTNKESSSAKRSIRNSTLQKVIDVELEPPSSLRPAPRLKNESNMILLQKTVEKFGSKDQQEMFKKSSLIDQVQIAKSVAYDILTLDQEDEEEDKKNRSAARLFD